MDRFGADVVRRGIQIFALFALVFVLAGLVGGAGGEVAFGLMLGGLTALAYWLFVGTPDWLARLMRSVPPETRWMFPASLAMAFVGSLLLLAGVRTVVRQLRFDREGVAVQGTVESVHEEDAPSKPGGGGVVSSWGRRMTIVDYRYRTREGRIFRGTGNVSRDVRTEDGTVRVTYLPARPDESELESKAGLGYALFLMGSVALAFGVGFGQMGARQLASAILGNRRAAGGDAAPLEAKP